MSHQLSNVFDGWATDEFDGRANAHPWLCLCLCEGSWLAAVVWVAVGVITSSVETGRGVSCGSA